jgi:hypothetical protein
MSAALLAGCADQPAPADGETGDDDTPPLEDDLVAATPGGKYDTGYLSNLAAELEGSFNGVLRIDVRSMSAEEQQAELTRLSNDQWAVQRLIDGQIKFSKNQLNSESLHLNLSSSGAELTSTELVDDHIVINYTTTVETIVSTEELAEEGTSLQQILETEFSAVVPDNPPAMHESVGAACLEEGHEEASGYNYFYYYAPEREGCAEAMAAAGVGRVNVTLDVRNLAPSKTVFPEYDQLVADNRIDVVVFFGAADHDWQPGEWDWGTAGRDSFVRDLTSRQFRLTDDEEDGDLYTRTVGTLVENVRVVGPETLKLLRDDVDGLFLRLVRSNEIVFYNGHSFYGSLSVLDNPELYPGSYQIFFINSCWSYEYYTKQLFEHNVTTEDPDGWLNVDVVNDTESGWFHNMAPESRILLTNLLAGAESMGVDGDRYYTWDRIIGAMNDFAVERQAARSTKSHEIYGVSGVRTNRFDPTGNVDPEPSAQTFTSNNRVAIPDNNPEGASDTIDIAAGQGIAAAVTVTAEIEHTWVGDLTVTLHHGDRYFTLHGRTGGSADNLSLEHTTDHFEGMSAAGPWTLKVVDSVGADTGAITGWSISL